MAGDEVSQRANEIAQRRQRAAEEAKRVEETQQLEIDWQVERASERLEAVKKYFLNVWTQSTRSEVIWGVPDPDIIDEHDGANDPVELPDVSVSASIQFWRRSTGLPVLTKIGTVTVSNSAYPLWSADDHDGTTPFFVEQIEGAPVRHFTYEFEVAKDQRHPLAENAGKAWGDMPNAAAFAAGVADIAMDVLAVSESNGIKVVPIAQAEAEVRDAARTSSIQEGFGRILAFVVRWALLFAGIAFFRFVIWPPLSVWLRAQGIIGH